MKIVSFSELPVGAIFRVMKSERHSLKQHTSDGRISNIVLNNGHYFKVANSHAVDIVTGKDCIFSLKMPCRELGTNASFAKAAADKYGVAQA